MKKFSVITFLMIGPLLFFGNISISYAEEVHSKVTGTLIQPDETTDTDEPGANTLKPPSKNDLEDNNRSESEVKKDNYSKGNLFSKLPQTGETIKWGISIVGILLVVVSVVTILMKRRRNNNENK
ncbi:TPA: LPXTG cell wall anchor domain-containing protein [Enterococcus faecalis]|nr:LPXTG cell wall anchor domain-containing protein [Enterococcus faecalis]HEM7729866.1 LPXTG cell wall anchor domain-containing protein [Enterococcus faecalis]